MMTDSNEGTRRNNPRWKTWWDIVSKMICRTLACPVGTLRISIDGDCESRLKTG